MWWLCHTRSPVPLPLYLNVDYSCSLSFPKIKLTKMFSQNHSNHRLFLKKTSKSFHSPNSFKIWFLRHQKNTKGKCVNPENAFFIQEKTEKRKKYVQRRPWFWNALLENKCLAAFLNVPHNVVYLYPLLTFKIAHSVITRKNPSRKKRS